MQGEITDSICGRAPSGRFSAAGRAVVSSRPTYEPRPRSNRKQKPELPEARAWARERRTARSRRYGAPSPSDSERATERPFTSPNSEPRTINTGHAQPPNTLGHSRYSEPPGRLRPEAGLVRCAGVAKARRPVGRPERGGGREEVPEGGRGAETVRSIEKESRASSGRDPRRAARQAVNLAGSRARCAHRRGGVFVATVLWFVGPLDCHISRSRVVRLYYLTARRAATDRREGASTTGGRRGQVLLPNDPVPGWQSMWSGEKRNGPSTDADAMAHRRRRSR